jgi:CheY-like chemotaxis protein
MLPRRILVVDDQEAKFELLKKIARSSLPDTEFEYVRHLRAAIPLLESYPWDLVVLDMSFGVNDAPSEASGFVELAGLQVLQHMDRADMKVPVIIYTAHTNFSNPPRGNIVGIEELEKWIRRYFEDIFLGCIYSKDGEEKQAAKFARLIGRNTGGNNSSVGG